MEKAVIWTHQSEYQLTEDEALKVIEEYNKSKYGGRVTGEGGTLDFGLIIFFENGQRTSVNDFCVKMEVSHNKKSFYLENENLYYIIKELSGL